jgi:signal transduction histidine kinase
VSLWSTIARSRRPDWKLSALVAGCLIVAMAVLRLVVAGRFPLPVGYGVPIVLMGLFGSRRFLWLATLAFAAMAVIKFFFLIPEAPRVVNMSARGYDYLEGGLVLLDLLLVAGVVDIWIVTRNWLDAKHADLESANSDLAAREEEIARQNEELQSQTEELERQSEELRVANEELAHREKTLEVLLSLSRSLHTELSNADIMDRICQTLGLLVNGPSTAAAILEQVDDNILVRCHHGFGEGGVSNEAIAVNRSFAALIVGKGRTGYIEDLSLRPDLMIPQPKEGEAFKAILATPLRVRGKPVGSLEVYSRHKTSWNQEQISLVESLAAQASVSLEAAELFQTVTRERNRFEAVLRTAPIGVIVCNPNCTEIRLNPAGAAILNVPVDQPITIDQIPKLWQCFREGQPVPLEQLPAIRAARENQETYALELETVLANGQRLICLNHARPILDVTGQPRGAVAAFMDITAQKELQRELDVRRREAEEGSVRKTRFLAAVSHDIRTPANAISLLAELIRRTASNPSLSADVPDLAQELQASALSLVNLLSDVLDIARFDSDKIDLQEAEFPLAALLQDEQKQLLPLARQKDLSIHVEPLGEAIVLRTDRIKLARVLGNLIGNAIKFTDKGEVRVSASRDGDGSVEISVADTGIGIAPEYLSHIFDEFFQLRNPERDRSKGTGLGLTICKRLVDAMGGALRVHSTPGQGSKFVVTLPSYAVVPQTPSA